MQLASVSKPTIVMAGALAGLLSTGLWLRAQQAPDASAKPKEAPARAGELPPRAAPTDYPSQGKAGMITIAADFMGHGVPTAEAGPYSTEDFVVVETGIFGPAGSKLQLSPQDFSLRVNGKKQPLASESYLSVFKSLKDPEWEPPPSATKSKTTVGGGGGETSQDDLPPIIHMPMDLRHAMEQRVIKASFPEGDRALPQAGLLFFEYHGAVKGIRSAELIYSGPAGKAAIPLHVQY